MLQPKYYISKDNQFVIENYNNAAPFSSFFPGIAGIFGCPMWVFYCNRGQCISSAGVKDKNGAIIEFQSANKAYRNASLQGWRTFIKVDGRLYEPFAEISNIPNEMRISLQGLELIEENQKLKIKVEVSYFTIPGEDFPGLARKVKITNLGSKARKIEVLDGLPALVPYGFSNDLLKTISRTIEAWCVVENGQFCKLKVEPSDSSKTKFIASGNFFVATGDQVIIDPEIIFGKSTSFQLPEKFLEPGFKIPENQQTTGFTPAAFTYKKITLEKNSSCLVNSLIGQADDLESFCHIKEKASSNAYFQQKELENKQLINSICNLSSCTTSSQKFDLYVKQTFLDNVMRGGLPISLGDKVLYVYYRKHGDMERDYNSFCLMPSYFSQGNGNYRDISQNRRSDSFFNPTVLSDNISRFFNLVQLDGFNPLVVLGSRLKLPSGTIARKIIKKHVVAHDQALEDRLTLPFTLGEALKGLIKFKTSREDFAAALVKEAKIIENAVHGEGFWIDHAFYNTDLLESFESLFPDQLSSLVFRKTDFTYYDNDHVVLERLNKYQLVDGKVRQYQSVAQDFEKTALISNRPSEPNLVRTNFGKGKIYKTTLAAKILCLVANKAASFDPAGVGLEMEADKPDWYDAINGLPGLFGSSLSETLELKRLCQYFLRLVKEEKGSIILAIEIKNYLTAINKELKKFNKAKKAFTYWDNTYALKEEFRSKTKLGLNGKEASLSNAEILGFLENVIKKCNFGIKHSLKKYKNYFTYFINETVDYKKSFKQTPLPLFLEGFVHALKVEDDKSIYQRVKKSSLFDKKLKMYKVNASLADEPIEIGRCKIFTPGWLENESIWLHMEYKYLLELLKAGLYKEFFADFKDVMIPFQDPKQYKRSILENSSFLASSSHPNPEIHGQGFVARLSGACAEFIDIWIIMMTGKKMFYLDKAGQLCFKLAPKLPSWLFKNGELSFTLFGSIEVTYLNPKNKNTYSNTAVSSYVITLVTGQEVTINKPTLPENYALLIRDRKVKKIVATLA